MIAIEETRRSCLALIAQLKEYYGELPPPRPGDWLAHHDERGQPFSSIATPLSFRKQQAATTRIHLFHTIDFGERFGHLLPGVQRFLGACFQTTADDKGVFDIACVPTRDRGHLS